MPRSFCFVSPSLAGPTVGEGIGTCVRHAARILASEYGCDVSLLLTRYRADVQAGTAGEWVEHYGRAGIMLFFLDDCPQVGGTGDAMLLTSLAVDRFLLDHRFDIVHFQDRHGNGFVPIQRKRLGDAHGDVTFTVTTHSPTEWLLHGNKVFAPGDSRIPKANWYERYSCAHADYLLSPSQYMLNWHAANGCPRASEGLVLPRLIADDALPDRADPVSDEWDFRHLVFFGKLEARKGLELFDRAVRAVLSENGDAFRKISFIGKAGAVDDGRPAPDAVIDALAKDFPGLEVVRHEQCATEQALALIRRERGVPVMPSLQDNAPMAVLECLESGFPFLASAVGGIPEYVDPAWLVAPDWRALARKLACLAQVFSVPPAHPYDRAKAVRALGALASVAPKTVTPSPRAPKVSVCVPFYNYGRFLPRLLAAFDRQDYENFELILVNDGSSETSTQIFEAFK